jgi:hypothetical protein
MQTGFSGLCGDILYLLGKYVRRRGDRVTHVNMFEDAHNLMLPIVSNTISDSLVLIQLMNL